MTEKMTVFPWGGKCTGGLSPGCKSCQEGRSTVIFVTGMCNATCYYCPVSLNRMFHDQAFANEKPVSSSNEVLHEIRLCNSRAASFTGGDPLLVADRCLEFAGSIKMEFGQEFFIHLYTPGREGSPVVFEKLSKVIDEIRFHPKLPNDVEKLVIATKYNWNVGIEVPAVPGLHKQKFFRQYVREYAEACRTNNVRFPFLNINELEITERNFSALVNRNLIIPDRDVPLGNGVSDSKEEAEAMIDYLQQNHKEINVHFCPAAQKDSVQLPNRLLHRAHSVMLPSDFVVEDWTTRPVDRGLLIRGVIRFPQLSSTSLPTMQQQLQQLQDARKLMISNFNMPSDQIHVDSDKSQLLTRADFLEEFATEIRELFSSIEVTVGMVEEYPTDDRLETSFIPF